MRKGLFFFLLIAITGINATAQEQKLKKNYFLKTTLVKVNDSIYNVYLADVTDTAIISTAELVAFRSMMSPRYITNPYTEIRSITVKRKGSAGRGALIGLIVGAAAGGIIGAIAYEDCDNCWFDFGIGFDIITGAIVGGGAGGLIGLIVGIAKKRSFIINGDRSRFEKMKLSVLDMAYKNVPAQ